MEREYFNMGKTKLFYKNLYLSIIIAIYILVLASPFMVNYFHFENAEFAEFIILFLLLILGFCANHFYKKESKLYEQQINLLKNDSITHKERIESAYKHIGSINVQLEELNLIFNKINKYPETKKEIKYILTFFTEKILLIANTEWVLYRIVDVKKQKTLMEVYISRNKDQIFSERISNKNLINNVPFDNLSAISSTNDTFRIDSYFIFPVKVNNEQKIMIETIANQAEMLYIIFSSIYYKGKNIEIF